MPISIQTYEGVPAGMNLANPQFELADNEARYLQDILLDFPGLVRRRGLVRAASGFPTLPNKASGLFGTLNPNGDFRMAALDGDGSNGYLRLLTADLTSYSTYNWNGAMPASPPGSPYRIVDSKPALTGGAFIGTSSQYNASSPTQNLALWRGGISATYSTGTITLTRGSAVVTGNGTSWVANASPGMFLFATLDDGTSGVGKYSLTFVGIVKSVDSNTQLTLGANAPFPQNSSSLGSLAYQLAPVRGLVPRIAKGRLTTTTGSTTVTGANTKFQSQGMDESFYSSSGTTNTGNGQITGLASTSTLKVGMRVSGTGVASNAYISSIDSATQVTVSANGTANATNTITFRHAWLIYRASDLAYIGRLSSVTNDTSLTLTANAAIALNNERFLAIKPTGDWGLSNQKTDGLGFLTATYAERQWFANNGQRAEYTSRVWFSDPSDPEAVDLTTYDGDFINIASSIGTDTPIKALVPAYNALVCIKENETYAIYGNTPTTFSVKKIEDDGTLSGMSAQGYGGGVIWAGRDGIHFYDGISVKNLSAGKLGDYYKNALRDVNPTQYRMWSMMVRDHYFLYIENYAPSVGVFKGSYSVTPASATIVINMTTQAFSIFTNLNIRGAVETPADTGKAVLYLVNNASGGNICQGNDLFDADGSNDTILCDGGSSATRYRYGVTAVGSGTTLAAAADTKYVSPITTAVRTAVNSISVYLGGQGATGATTNMKAVLYSDVAGAPSALLGTSAEQSVDRGTQPGFVTFTFSSAVEIAAGTYWIGVINETGSIVNLYRGATADQTAHNSDTYAGGAADPFGSPTLTTGPLVAFATVSAAGPDFYLESKKYAEGDAMRKKLFKQLALTYLAQGDSLRLDTVVGLNNVGTTSSTSFPSSVYTWDSLAAVTATWDTLAALYPTWDSVVLGVYRPRRIKFLKRTQVLSFRLWQNSPSVTRANIGPFQLGYKWQRAGRI